MFPEQIGSGGRHEADQHGYPEGRELKIMADCGGSNGARVRLWKLELQTFADESESVRSSSVVAVLDARSF